MSRVITCHEVSQLKCCMHFLVSPFKYQYAHTVSILTLKCMMYAYVCGIPSKFYSKGIKFDSSCIRLPPRIFSGVFLFSKTSPYTNRRTVFLWWAQ